MTQIPSQKSFLKEITPVILTYDEQENIARTLDCLVDFEDVVVVDSGSGDSTLDIIQRYDNTRVFDRAFDTHSKQWTFAIRDTAIDTKWILALDADYQVSKELLQEMKALNPDEDVKGFEVEFTYCVFGHALSGSLYPPIYALYRSDSVEYFQDGHTQRALITGNTSKLVNKIYHDDRKPLDRWLRSQASYADLEAELLRQKKSLSVNDKVRSFVVIAPWIVPLHYLLLKRGVFDGWPGIFYALQRGIAEAILSIKIIEKKLLKKN